MRILLILSFVLTALGLRAQEAASTPPAAAPGMATVYFLRATGFQGSAGAFTAFIDGKLACRLNNKRYSIHQVPPGEHFFTVQFAGKEAKAKALGEKITVTLEAGKTYYIQMNFQTGFTKNNLYPQEITEGSAKKVMADNKMTEDKDCE